MSAWRRVALERFPERTSMVKAAYSVFDLLRQLETDLRAVYRCDRSEPDLPDRVFAFAAWCFQAQQNWHLRNAVAVGFYQHLPDVEAGRRDLAERLSKEALAELRPMFFQALPHAIYDAFSLEIERVHGDRSL